MVFKTPFRENPFYAYGPKKGLHVTWIFADEQGYRFQNCGLYIVAQCYVCLKTFFDILQDNMIILSQNIVLH